jgi:hypothetical protein
MQVPEPQNLLVEYTSGMRDVEDRFDMEWVDINVAVILFGLTWPEWIEQGISGAELRE